MTSTDPIPDAELLSRMRQGNAKAFTELYRRHEAPLYRFALLRCGAAETAADIVQEIFLGLLNDSLRFDPLRGALRSFLFGVARNMLFNRYDMAQRTVSSSSDDAEGDDDDYPDSAPAPLERLLASEASEQVRNALQRIAPHYRDVLILYEMHDLSYLEIAQICGIDLGTVRSRLSRARSKMMALLALDGAPDKARQYEVSQ